MEWIHETFSSSLHSRPLETRSKGPPCKGPASSDWTGGMALFDIGPRAEFSLSLPLGYHYYYYYYYHQHPSRFHDFSWPLFFFLEDRASRLVCSRFVINSRLIGKLSIVIELLNVLLTRARRRAARRKDGEGQSLN